MGTWTNWRKLIDGKMDVNGETWEDVEHINGDIDSKFYNDWGSPPEQGFRLWTTGRVYFGVNYDGQVYVESVSREPNEETRIIGGEY